MSLAAKAVGGIVSVLPLVFAAQLPVTFRGLDLIALLLVSALSGLLAYVMVSSVMRQA